MKDLPFLWQDRASHSIFERIIILLHVLTLVKGFFKIRLKLPWRPPTEFWVIFTIFKDPFIRIFILN